MLSLENYDRAEKIADALHRQEGLTRALLDTLCTDLCPETEMVALALVEAMTDCRRTAQVHAREIAVSGKEVA